MTNNQRARKVPDLLIAAAAETPDLTVLHHDVERQVAGHEGYPDPMTSDAVMLLREALALPDGDRADIAAELLASLPEPPGTLAVDSDEWARQIDRRARDVLSGDTATEDWDGVEERILGKLSNA